MMLLLYLVVLISTFLVFFGVNATDCGGPLSGNGTIVINDTTAAINETCSWTIKAEKPYQTSIVLNTMSENGNLLEIYDGDLKEAKNDTELLYNYTNSMGEKWMVGLSNVTTIIFTRTVAITGDIQIVYTANKCEKVVNSGEISPPIYLPGRGGFNCNFQIGQTVVKPYTGILAFLSFNLPNGELLIKGNNFTGTTLPEDRILGAKPNVTASLTIRNSSAVQTFSGVVTQAAEQCTKLVTVNMTTSLTYTLDIPSVHPQATECRVIFTSQNNKPLMASLLSVKLMGADRLVLNDGSSQGDKDLLGGSVLLSGRRVLSKGGNLWMRVVIDTVPGDREVKLDITEIESGGRFYNEGKITLGVSKGDNKLSAATPTDYYYQLVGTSQVEVNLTQTDIAGFVEFYDGFLPDSLLITTFSPKSTFYPVTSPGSNLLIVAKNFTSESVPGSFNSVIDSCNVVTSGNKGSYSLSTLSVNQTQCQWTISPQNKDGVISLEFKTVSLRAADSLMINSISNKTNLLAKFSGPAEVSFIPNIDISASKLIQIVFETSNNCSVNCTEPLVAADYTQNEACVGQLQHPSGVLTSPKWPNVYPVNAQCLWADAETVKSTQMLYISFDKFNLPNNHSLELMSGIQEAWNINKKFTGNKLPDDIIIKGDNYQLIFNSKQTSTDLTAEVGQGFQAKYRFLDCGGFITNESSTIQSPESTNMSDVCVWIIQLPADPKIKNISVINFELVVKNSSCKNNLNSNPVKVYDGGSVRAPLLLTNNTQNSTRTMSRTDTLLIMYDRSVSSNNSFTFNYTRYVCKFFCKNGACLHPNWRCNHLDECGDNSDEQDCVYPFPPSTTPSPSKKGGKSGVASYWVVLCLLFGIVMGVLFAIFIPHIYKRLRFQNYSTLRESNNPIV